MGAAVDRLRKLSGSIAGFTLFAGAAALLTPQARLRLGAPYWLLWLAASIGAAITVNELVGKPVPFAVVLPDDDAPREASAEVVAGW